MSQKEQTILVAEDDAGNLLLLKAILSKANYKVISVTNGQDVLVTLPQLESGPDLLLLDIMMPIIDGLEVCRRVKKDFLFRQIPVIFITARDRTDDIIQGFEAGASDYITKPINKAEMLARVNTHIKLYHSIRELERLNKLALDANPLTGYPGNNSIIEFINHALNSPTKQCVIYLDLDNFKAFNDKYGFARGDQAIKYTLKVIDKVLSYLCDSEYFIGHIGGDDFTVIAPSEIALKIGQEIVRQFDRGVGTLYDQTDLKAGFIMASNRKGVEEKYPIMALSMGAVDLAQGDYTHYLDVANECAEVKKRAKVNKGSCICFSHEARMSNDIGAFPEPNRGG
ncbi:response regulator [candidate division CSSED10-310 bacterium]|uniref:Response regulator n=1 Tax=candidate division CSSED10-310 bacterium TaxID=2855610 RepID=A0ABV6Z113_UNCC1